MPGCLLVIKAFSLVIKASLRGSLRTSLQTAYLSSKSDRFEHSGDIFLAWRVGDPFGTSLRTKNSRNTRYDPNSSSPGELFHDLDGSV